MPISFLTTALLIVSVITNLTVEGIKKLLDGTKVKYSSNVLAAVLSVLIACAVSVIYLIMTDTVFTMKIGVEIVVLMYLGFLISTVGYDKVIQMLKQIQSVKEETKMSNSPLVSYTKLSPNHSGQRTHAVDRITPHCVVGQCSVETLGNIFAPTSRQASCQYGIGVDGRVGMYVEEKNRSWCSSSNANDQRAITIECASDATHPYAFNDTVYAKLIELCTDICKRYGKTKLLWFGDKTKTLNYEPASNEMVLTVHRWFANKSCPGDWMYARMGDLASKVTAKLGGSAGGTEKPADNQVLYRVQTGAFSNKANADAMLQKVKAAGFDTYMVKVDNLYKIQVGAFSKKANADAMAAKLKAAGFDTYITTKSGTAVSASSAKKSTDQIAREVIQGLWGNGADRTNRLKAAGYDPSVIQNRVNQLLK